MALPKPGDPYVTTRGKVLAAKGDGTEIDTFPSADVSIGSGTARNHVPSKRRSITELPAEPRTQTALTVVLFYSLFGLSDNEIAHTVNISVSDVKKLKSLDAYQETYDLLFWEMIHSNGQSLVAKIAKAAPAALDEVINLGKNAVNENAKLKANQDILDRSGLHPEVLFGKQAGDNLDGLKIVVRKADDDKTDVEIDFSRR